MQIEEIVNEDNTDYSDTDREDPNFDLSVRRKQCDKSRFDTPESITLELPRKGLAKKLTASAGRMKLSTNQSFAYAADIIKAGKGKLSDFSISRSTFYKKKTIN